MGENFLYIVSCEAAAVHLMLGADSEIAVLGFPVVLMVRHLHVDAIACLVKRQPH